MKRIVSLFLILCMLLGTLMLVACPAPDDGGTTTTTTKNPGGGDKPSEWADRLDTEAVRAEIGKDAELVISCLNQFDYQVYAEEDSKDALDQLVYKRNKKIEERFGFKIVPDIINAQREVDLSTHYDYALTELRSMQPKFDILCMMLVQSGRLVAQDHYRDLRSSVPYVRESLTANDPWWNYEMNINSTLHGRQYIAFSDYCISLIDSSFAFIFNESLVDEYNIARTYGAAHEATYETMYDIVKAGDWTIDSMIEMTKDVWYEVDGLGTPGTLDTSDIIGYYNSGGSELDNFPFAFGFKYIENDGVGDPTIWTYPSTFDGLVTKLRSYFKDSDGGKINPFSYSYEQSRQSFAEGHIVFMTGWLDDFKRPSISGMEDNRGVLPYPKLNRDQTDYKTSPSDTSDGLSIPRYTKREKLKLAGAMTVALSAETHKSITEIYYEMVVKHDSGFVNTAAVEMIDKIMEGTVFDFSILHSHDLNFSEDNGALFNTYLRYLINHAPNTSPSGLWDEAGPVLEGKLKSLINSYTKLK